MSLQCPICGSQLDRVHCHTADRFIGLFVPVRRYRCHNSTCGWERRQISRFPKQTNSIRNLRFKIAALMILLATASGAFFGGWFVSKPDAPPVSGSDDSFPNITDSDLNKLKQKLDKENR